jgi:hypothetical protein
MPSKRVTANTTVQSVAAAVRNGVHIPTSVTIDNDGGSQDLQISIQDIFTPVATNGDASPTEQTVNRHTIDVLQGDVLTLSEEDLKGVKCLGTLGIIADAIDAACYITVGYKTE